MPIYEYRCDACGHEFEVMQKITENPIRTCESCKARKVKRMISQTSFHLKGGGWYADLYGSSSSKTGTSSSSSSSTTKPSGSKTEAKKSDSGGSKSSSATPAKKS